MSRFSAATAGKGGSKTPQRHVTLPPSAFSDKWSGKPSGNVAVGLRIVGQAQVETARGEAAKTAWELHDKPGDVVAREVAYEDRLMAWIVAFAACDPNDRTVSKFTPDGIVQELQPDGIRRLYDEFEAFAIEQSPLVAPATDHQIETLIAAIAAGAIDNLQRARAVRVRKLLSFILAELATAATEDDTPADVSEAAAEENVRSGVLLRAG